MALITAAVATAVAMSAGGCSRTGAAIVHHPKGAATPRLAVDAFLRAVEGHNTSAMRQLMTPSAQENEGTIQGGLLRQQPPLTSYRIRGVKRENPRNNASPPGSIASLRYTVALTPSTGFDNDDTDGSAYDILVCETHTRQWLVAELGGSG